MAVASRGHLARRVYAAGWKPALPGRLGSLCYRALLPHPPPLGSLIVAVAAFVAGLVVIARGVTTALSARLARVPLIGFAEELSRMVKVVPGGTAGPADALTAVVRRSLQARSSVSARRLGNSGRRLGLLDNERQVVAVAALVDSLEGISACGEHAAVEQVAEVPCDLEADLYSLG